MNTGYTQQIKEDIRAIRFRKYLAIGLLLIWLMRFFQKHWLSQLGEPVLIAPKSDNFYWLLHLLNIPQFIYSSPSLSLMLDLALLCLPLLIFFYPKRLIFGRLFFLLSILYLVSFNSASTHHEHLLLGWVLVGFYLSVKLKFSDLMHFALRYYSCFIMFSAALWKIFRAAFSVDQLKHILLQQHAQLLTTDPSNIYTLFIQWLIDRPFISCSLWYASILLELSFLLALFSYKFDKLLFLFFCCFILFDFIIMGLNFIPLGILGLFLIPSLQPPFFKPSAAL